MSSEGNNSNKNNASAPAAGAAAAAAAAGSSGHSNRNNNRRNNINDQNQSLFQQLLNRLHQAHDSIELDPIQGQFLLDASGGDLDMAVGLYWEDSVAHAAREASNGNNGVAASASASRGRNNVAKGGRSRRRRYENDSEFLAAAAASERGRKGAGAGGGRRSPSSQNLSQNDESSKPNQLNQPRFRPYLDNAHGLENGLANGPALGLAYGHRPNDDDSPVNERDRGEVKRSGSNSNSTRNNNNNRAYFDFSSNSNSNSDNDNNRKIGKLKRRSSRERDRDRSSKDGKFRSGGGSHSSSSNSHSHGNNRSQLDLDDFLRAISGPSTNSATSTNRKSPSNILAAAAAALGDDSMEFFHNDGDALSLALARRRASKSASKGAGRGSLSLSVAKKGSSRGTNDNNNNNNNDHGDVHMGDGREDVKSDTAAAAAAAKDNDDDNDEMNDNEGNNHEVQQQEVEGREEAGQQQQQQQHQQQQQGQQPPLAEIEAADDHAESVNVSDDEAAAMAERLLNQINHPKGRGSKGNAYKFALQKQIQKITRKRKKGRNLAAAQQGSDNNEGGGLSFGGASGSGSGHKRKRHGFEERNSSDGRSDSKLRKKKGRHESLDTSIGNDLEEYKLETDTTDNDSDDAEVDEREKIALTSSNLKKIINFSENKKGFLIERLNAEYDQNKRRKKDLDESHNENDNFDSVSSSAQDGNESDLEKANIRDAFDFAKHDSVAPSRLLWGAEQICDSENDASNSEQSEQPDNSAEVESPNLRESETRNSNDAGNGKDDSECKDVVEVISNNDGNDHDDEEEEDNSKSGEKHFETVIPRTWLSAGFQLSPCGTGLVLPQPVDTELARLKSIQSIKYPRGTSSIAPPLPPYHCGGITAILSIVTALLYTGASIQGKEVNCSSCQKKPFADLSLDERKRQFPERLADALSSLLFIAAKDSTKARLTMLEDIEEKLQLKRKRLKKHKIAIVDTYDSDEVSDFDGKDLPDEDKELEMKQLMKNRTKLCSVCHWEVDTNGDLKVPLDQLIDNDDLLRFSITLTNSKDLRSFVWANMGSFMGPGGCALFLETVVNIHGIPRLTRILSQLKGSVSEEKNRPFIKCNCEDRVKLRWEESLKAYQKRAVSGNCVKANDCNNIPPGHECISTELISLLITGKAHNTMNYYSPSNLGFGVISIDAFEGTSKRNLELLSPPKPIWLVKGASSYSVLWNNKSMSTDRNVLTESWRGSACPFHLTYWNPWHDPMGKKFDGKIIPERKVMSCYTNSSFNQNKEETSSIRKEDIKNIAANSDDQKYYQDFRRWRFCMSERNCDKADKNIKWIPFFRLNKREKRLVEMKMAPQINLAIWSLWPGSDIEWKPSAKIIS